MTSRKYEKALGKSFWKKSSLSALPGRPNLSNPGVAHGGGGPAPPSPRRQSASAAVTAAAAADDPAMPSSFRAFEASVSDAWNINDEDAPPAGLQPTSRPPRSNEEVVNGGGRAAASSRNLILRH